MNLDYRDEEAEWSEDLEENEKMFSFILPTFDKTELVNMGKENPSVREKIEKVL